MNFPIYETSNKSGAILVVLKRSNEMSRLLPTGHGPCIDAP